jgi:hypothetical protein
MQTSQFELPVGLRRWNNSESMQVDQVEGFEYDLIDDCDNAYRFTVSATASKIGQIFNDVAAYLSDEAFFILEFYPDDSLLLRPSSAVERPTPTIYYSSYLPTRVILNSITPYLGRMVHDGFVGFGLANNHKGLEFFCSEEKVLTFFTDNHLRLSTLLHRHQVAHRSPLILPADFGHDHISLMGLQKKNLPGDLKLLSSTELDSTLFCNEIVDNLDMYEVEEGLSFFLTRKEQVLITELVEKILPDQDFTDAEFGGLLLDWSDFVSECEVGFEGDLWEYRQCLKIRDAIQLIIEATPTPLSDKINHIVSKPDNIFQEALTDRRRRLDAPAEMQLRQTPFWYQGITKKQGTELRRDLIRYGWFNRQPLP